MILPGLTATNPAAYLAALGLTRLLSCRLSWTGDYLAELDIEPDLGALMAIAAERAQQEPYTWPVIKPAQLLADGSDKPNLSALSDYASDWIAALVGLSPNAKKDPAYLPRQGSIIPANPAMGGVLKIARDALAMTSIDNVMETLHGPWRYSAKLGPLGHDPAIIRTAASGDTTADPMGVAVTSWLAFEAAPFYPMQPYARGEHWRFDAPGFERDRFRYRTWRGFLTVQAIALITAADITIPGLHHAQFESTLISDGSKGSGRRMCWPKIKEITA
jgi:hypothetical protein